MRMFLFAGPKRIPWTGSFPRHFVCWYATPLVFALIFSVTTRAAGSPGPTPLDLISVALWALFACRAFWYGIYVGKRKVYVVSFFWTSRTPKETITSVNMLDYTGFIFTAGTGLLNKHYPVVGFTETGPGTWWGRLITDDGCASVTALHWRKAQTAGRILAETLGVPLNDQTTYAGRDGTRSKRELRKQFRDHTRRGLVTLPEKGSFVGSFSAGTYMGRYFDGEIDAEGSVKWNLYGDSSMVPRESTRAALHKRFGNWKAVYFTPEEQTSLPRQPPRPSS